jgi:putative lipoic acid-binding regulatory protein
VRDSQESPFAFPCDFPIKAVGRAGQGFEQLVLDVVRRHAADLDPSRVVLRQSRSGNWVSVTVVVRARGKGQLDAIYRELSGDERVVWAL